MADWQNALARAEAHSPFLSRAMGRLPGIVALLAAGEGEAALAAREAGEGAPDLGAALRREKLATALVLAIGDLAGAFPLLRVTGELTALADRALDRAIAHAITTRVPDAAPAGFVALALGKQGAGELNYSSDIDPILLYDPATLPRRPRDEPAEAALHVARTLLRLVSQVDGEGYVFRVDLRLRPPARSARWRCRWKRRSRITNPPRWRGNAPPSSARARQRAMCRWASISSPRSAPSCGANRWISARSTRSAASPAASARIMARWRRLAPAST
jgi:glutamine synthetase adenylyltransferase